MKYVILGAAAFLTAACNAPTVAPADEIAAAP